MSKRWAANIIIVAAGLFAGIGTLVAQVPPHRPGTVCIVSPTFWCWANPRGNTGEPCSCPTPSGPIQGTLR